MTARQIRRVTPVASGPPLAIGLAAVEDQVPWQTRGLCAETDPDAFFPEKGASTRAAKNVCRGCEVRAECLEFALDTDQRFGIWGGTSEKERRALRRLRGQGQEVAA
ncbi:hypothetical protein BJF79_03405 [Actinomadura sp. CNU-125]|uniref:WhiB family transcriptional regulator n=1 Tax=Actinomadura sp. CNU-125 TaxID=1904961 RepID=UPI00095B1A82|nr:WhiB family transcriptional regulator [Actinomadura sp. CNU-125]OLT12960.1 hypothetical protein BJF79_03405 [Actinomadura sp. CNU-125]